MDVVDFVCLFYCLFCRPTVWLVGLGRRRPILCCQALGALNSFTVRRWCLTVASSTTASSSLRVAGSCFVLGKYAKSFVAGCREVLPAVGRARRCPCGPCLCRGDVAEGALWGERLPAGVLVTGDQGSVFGPRGLWRRPLCRPWHVQRMGPGRCASYCWTRFTASVPAVDGTTI